MDYQVPTLTQISAETLEKDKQDVKHLVTKNNLPDRLIPQHPYIYIHAVSMNEYPKETLEIRIYYYGVFVMQVLEVGPFTTSTYKLNMKNVESIITYTNSVLKTSEITCLRALHKLNDCPLGTIVLMEQNNLSGTLPTDHLKIVIFEYLQFIQDTLVDTADKIPNVQRKTHRDAHDYIDSGPDDDEDETDI